MKFSKPLGSTLLAVALSCLLASTASAARAAAAASLSRFVQQVLNRGNEAHLPPHLAKVLSLSDGSRAVPVRQVASRVGAVVHTFNVVGGAHQQVVLLKHDEASQNTGAYALHADGTLRRAVKYQGGGFPEVLSAAAAAGDFRSELRFWNLSPGAEPPPPAAHGPDAAAPHP